MLGHPTERDVLLQIWAVLERMEAILLHIDSKMYSGGDVDRVADAINANTAKLVEMSEIELVPDQEPK